MVGSSPSEGYEAALLVGAFPVPPLVLGVEVVAAFSFLAGFSAGFSEPDFSVLDFSELVFSAPAFSELPFSDAGFARESLR
jgi:hypothetical protein